MGDASVFFTINKKASEEGMKRSKESMEKATDVEYTPPETPKKSKKEKEENEKEEKKENLNEFKKKAPPKVTMTTRTQAVKRLKTRYGL